VYYKNVDHSFGILKRYQGQPFSVISIINKKYSSPNESLTCDKHNECFPTTMLVRYIQEAILIYVQLFRMYKSGTRNTYIAVPYNPIVRSTQDVRTSIVSIHSTCENQYQYINTTRRTVHSPPASTTNRKATKGKLFQEVYGRGGNWPVSKHIQTAGPYQYSTDEKGDSLYILVLLLTPLRYVWHNFKLLHQCLTYFSLLSLSYCCKCTACAVYWLHIGMTSRKNVFRIFSRVTLLLLSTVLRYLWYNSKQFHQRPVYFRLLGLSYCCKCTVCAVYGLHIDTILRDSVSLSFPAKPAERKILEQFRDFESGNILLPYSPEKVSLVHTIASLDVLYSPLGNLQSCQNKVNISVRKTTSKMSEAVPKHDSGGSGKYVRNICIFILPISAVRSHVCEQCRNFLYCAAILNDMYAFIFPIRKFPVSNRSIRSGE